MPRHRRPGGAALHLPVGAQSHPAVPAAQRLERRPAGWRRRLQPLFTHARFSILSSSVGRVKYYDAVRRTSGVVSLLSLSEWEEQASGGSVWGRTEPRPDPVFVSPDVKQALIQWQERIDFAHKLLTLLNSYSPPELRNACLGNARSPTGGGGWHVSPAPPVV